MTNNSPFHRVAPLRPRSRREFLWQSGGGLGGLALASLLGREQLVAAPASHSSLITPHFPPRAKRVVQLFMAGAASHLDLFDFKPELVKRDGQPSDFGEAVEAFQNGLGPWKKPVWDFRPYGQSGKMLSAAVADLGHVADELAFINRVEPLIKTVKGRPALDSIRWRELCHSLLASNEFVFRL